MQLQKSHALNAIFWAGLTAGVMDITAAFVTWAPQGVSPIRILQGIASGLLGAQSFAGGWRTAALGLACHFFIAFSAATVFYAVSRKLTFMTRRPIVSGILYGVAVYLVMYWIVMPLSNFHKRPFSWFATVIAIITHMVCVGTPISLVVNRYSRRS
jgi:uncharacterized membrane protein YagU involved in acid resistance